MRTPLILASMWVAAARLAAEPQPPGPEAEPRRALREHAAIINDKLKPLTRRYTYGPGQSTPWLAAQAAAADLDELERRLEDQFAYLRRAGIDHRAALDAVRAGLGQGICVADLAVQISKVLALFGDGHTRVRGLSDLLPRGGLPLHLACSGEQVLAWTPREWSGAGAPVHPAVVRLRSIDGVAIERWLDAAGETVCRGSPQLRRRLSLERLGFIEFVRQELELPAAPGLTIDMESAAGSILSATWLPLDEPLPPARHPRDRSGVSALAEGSIVLLRLAEMDEDAAPLVEQAMADLGAATGLIIDVRGNGGGSRDALLALYPHLAGPGSPPLIANVAAYRLSDRFPRDHLAARDLFRRDDDRFDDADRAAIDAFLPGFVPEWQPPADEFSAWHYMLLRGPHARTRGTQPVVVLMDGGCFSATDIFLAALRGLEGVTLMGTPSGGGSGRPMPVRLPHSGLEVRLSSMASFRRDGRLYDGRGIDPDVLVEPAPRDLAGITDGQLEAAIAHVQRAVPRAVPGP